MTGDRPTTPGWHCHRCRSTSCRQRADSDTDHVGRVEYRPLLLTQPSSVSWLWSHTHWCPSQRPQEVMRVDGSANPTMPKNPAQYELRLGVTSRARVEISSEHPVSRHCTASLLQHLDNTVLSEPGDPSTHESVCQRESRDRSVNRTGGTHSV